MGYITQIIGPVLDVASSPGNADIYNSLVVKGKNSAARRLMLLVSYRFLKRINCGSFGSISSRWKNWFIWRSRVGKTVLIMESINNIAKAHGESKVINEQNLSESKVALVYGGSEVSALLGRMPSAVGYQPTLGTEMGSLQERITSTKEGSITSIQAVYVPADDLTDPAPATTFAHLDATTVLSRGLAAKYSPVLRKYVSLPETIKGFQMILPGELDNLPEQAFYSVGNIDEAAAKAAALQAGGQ
ncbi:hypothetical protein L7F22_046789 [Adiantum nelumboides]|nr:hypothetical protein [Adiantum nelumboides]